MALYIVEADCISCGDCEPVCPTMYPNALKYVLSITASCL